MRAMPGCRARAGDKTIYNLVPPLSTHIKSPRARLGEQPVTSAPYRTADQIELPEPFLHLLAMGPVPSQAYLGKLPLPVPPCPIYILRPRRGAAAPDSHPLLSAHIKSPPRAGPQTPPSSPHSLYPLSTTPVPDPPILPASRPGR